MEPQRERCFTLRLVDSSLCGQPMGRTLIHSPVYVDRIWGIWRFPKIRGTILGGPYNKDYSIWGPYWGPLFREAAILGSYYNTSKAIFYLLKAY